VDNGLLIIIMMWELFESAIIAKPLCAQLFEWNARVRPNQMDEVSAGSTEEQVAQQRTPFGLGVLQKHYCPALMPSINFR
jgi:hypothetical protein